eukprot:CAMPEP_0183551502 /NCGR_PEP_ID=MMETSP0371-20130417/69340_1 /TAXON_ID=268820 /ORGANISM="Peridinium aciculiferum, Strain PAER-2" /LENGTH=53 /DNA_ID=CAMNT_0025756099 /DNA_START=53 /DNA_END=214 /DNA_ORIENTATION=-
MSLSNCEAGMGSLMPPRPHEMSHLNYVPCNSETGAFQTASLAEASGRAPHKPR